VKKTARVAAAQVAPVYLDLEASVARACDTIRTAGVEGAELIAFPETFLPGYPYFAITHDPTETTPFLARLRENAVQIPSPATEQLCKAARDAGCIVAMGINELEGGTLYNSQLLIDENGEILGVRRKLVPTNHERMVWGRGDGSDLRTFSSRLGILGALICYEHGNALFRYAVQAQHEVIHIAMWPGGMGGLLDIIDASSRHYGFEGQSFGVTVTSILTDHILKALGDGGSVSKFGTGGGRSMIVDPRGKVLAEAPPDEETILCAELNLDDIARAKMVVDSCGHYSRPDVVSLQLDARRKRPLEITREPDPQGRGFQKKR
jgi:aliphatic nitrilase